MYLRLFFQKLFLFLCYLKFSCQQLQYGTLLHDLGTYEGQLLNSVTRQGKILSGIMHGEGTFMFHNAINMLALLQRMTLMVNFRF